MGKVNYDGIIFDSELEVEYYKYLKKNDDVFDFYYHPLSIPNLVGKRSYQPDFIVFYKGGRKDCFYGRVEVVETKGYNPYSKMIDDQIHNVMLTKNRYWLESYVCNNIASGKISLMTANAFCNGDERVDFVYKKVKYLKAYGFVDWDFKNPNTIANKRKEKINDLSAEIKELKEFKKNALRYFNYNLNLRMGKKLTKAQQEWYRKFEEELMYMMK